MYLSVCLLTAALLSFALAAPQSQSIPTSAPFPTHVFPSLTASSALPTFPSTVTENNACATVASLVATETDAIPTIPASVAYDCLVSVPLNANDAVPWLEAIKPYLAWQTTLSYLKDPPSGYLEPAIDVYGLLDDMIANVNSYANEYELEFALYEIFQRTHDGHFRYLPTLMSGIFTFGRPLSLVSVSLDGQALPQPYVYSDWLLASNDSSFQPSAIVTIEGQDAVTYLENLSQYGSLQDPDALYNNVFHNLAQVSLGDTGSGAGTFAGGGRGAYVYPNDSTILTFANGSTSTYQNFARVLQNFTGISTGQDIYDQFLVPPLPANLTTPPPPPSTPTPAPGYPSPVIQQENNLIGGYYLDQPGYEDVAVLAVASFVGLQNEEASFQQVGFDFIAQSKADGKTKLVIDVSANGGGTILQGYSLFLNLFPDIIPYGGNRFRAHQAFDLMGQVISNVSGPVYPWNLTNPPGPDAVLNDFIEEPFDYRTDLDENLQNFVSWPQKYGPHEYNGDNFTSVQRWNLSDPTTLLENGIVVNGYENRTGIVPSRPYAVEDIVVLYDGYCASTCSIFSTFMTDQAGVKTIAIGGRPQKGPMQAVGGVKGRNDWDWQTVFFFANETFELVSPEEAAALEQTELGSYSDLPFLRSVDNDGYLNVRDGIAQGDTTGTPLQFIYQAADCHIFYEPDHVIDVSTMWAKAADIAFNGASCVQGGIGSNSNSSWSGWQGKPYQRRSIDGVEMQQLHDSIGLSTNMRGRKVIGDAYMLP